MKATKEVYRKRRHKRVRRLISGTAERPRLAVFRSLSHMYVQLIDDVAQHTLVAVSTLSPAFRGQGNGVEISQKIGSEVARIAQEKGISTVVFDRGGFTYGGRVKALADAAREAGLKF